MPGSPKWPLSLRYIYIYIKTYVRLMWAGIAQSVQQLATGWTVRESNSGGGEIKRPGHGVDHPPHLAPRLKKE
jgi:hypothetical protein